MGSQKEVQENSATTGERPEIMSQKDAAMFPIIASCALFGLYLFFQFFSKEHIKLLPATLIPNENYHLEFMSGEGDQRREILNIYFTSLDVLIYCLCSMTGIWYIVKKHWIANNLFGISFAYNGISIIHLNKVI